jgi:hypothetical protein
MDMSAVKILRSSAWLSIGLMAAWGVAQEGDKQPVKRAKRPVFSAREVNATYFKDLYKEALVGERPVLGIQMAAGEAASGPGGGGSTGGGDGRDWTSIIAPEVIENEIKSLKLAMDQSISTPVKFAGGGYQDARRQFSELAMLFAIINEHNSEVRWKADSASLRDAFARSAANSKTGSQQTYQEAKQRKQDLADIVGGNSFVGTQATEPENDWANICDRSPLMERLEEALGLVKPALANEAVFQAEVDVLRQEASLIAAMAEVLSLEGMDDAIEEDYTQYAFEMRDGAMEVVEALKLQNYDKAVSGMGAITKACSNCHDEWQ